MNARDIPVTELHGPPVNPKRAARRLAASAIRDGYVPQALHEYTDGDGSTVYWRIRAKHPVKGTKWIRPMRREGIDYVLGEPEFPDGKKPLYRLHEIVRGDATRPIFFVEGEAKADALAKRGLRATTSGSASSDDKADFEPLRGQHVITWPDNDAPGRDHMQRVADRFRALGCSVQMIDIEPLSLPEHGDALDYLATHPNATATDLMALPMVESMRAQVSIEKATTACECKALPAEFLPVEPFPLAALPDSVRPWCADVAERMNCPPEFVGVPLLVGLATLAARKVTIRPQQRTDWIERANLWALLIGRPGVMKSPAMVQALAPLERLEAHGARVHADELMLYDCEERIYTLGKAAAEKEAKSKLQENRAADISQLIGNEKSPKRPIRRRYLVTDATYEKLGEILAENPDGVLSVRDEIRGLLLHLAKEEQGPARAFYLQSWSGGRYTFDRIGRGTVTVPDARLSMVGCIQPGPLSQFISSAQRGGALDDGMIQRFLIVWPDDPGKWREVDRWPDSAAKRTARDAFDRLDSLDVSTIGAEQDTDYHGHPDGSPFLRLDDDARELFRDWRRSLEERLRGDELGEPFEAALSKFRKHVPALAITLHLADGGTGPITARPMLRALTLGEFFESHARRAYASGIRPTVAAAKSLLKKAQGGALEPEFTARDVYRNQWAGLSDRALVEGALDLLVSHRWLFDAEIQTGGRPQTVYVLTEGAKHG